MGPISPQKGHSPQFLGYVYCGQTAVCIRIPLGTEVGHSLGNIVLDGDPALPLKRGTATHFSAHVYCGQTAGWMPLGTKVGLGSGHIVLDGDPAPPPQKKNGHSPPILVHVYCSQRSSPVSATAEHLLVLNSVLVFC